MKKILITTILIFMILASILNTIYATDNLNTYIDNALLNAAQNANNKYEEALKKEDEALNRYNDLLNSGNNNKSENALPQTNNSNSTKLPQTGLSSTVYVFGTILTVLLVFIIFKLIKYRDI